jgi:hypothetical protein
LALGTPDSPYASVVSFDLAVFDYDAAPTQEDVAMRYGDLAEECDESPQSPRIDAFIAECVGRWPGFSDDDVETSPWASWPLEGQRSGGGFVANIVWSRAEEMRVEWELMAEHHGLVVYDPQEDHAVVPSSLGGSAPSRRGLLHRLRRLKKQQ